MAVPHSCAPLLQCPRSSHGRERRRLAAAKATIAATHTLACGGLTLHSAASPNARSAPPQVWLLLYKAECRGLLLEACQHGKQQLVGRLVLRLACVCLSCHAGLVFKHLIVSMQGFSVQAAPRKLQWWRPCVAVCSGSRAHGPHSRHGMPHQQGVGCLSLCQGSNHWCMTPRISILSAAVFVTSSWLCVFCAVEDS